MFVSLHHLGPDGDDLFHWAATIMGPVREGNESATLHFGGFHEKFVKTLCNFLLPQLAYSPEFL